VWTDNRKDANICAIMAVLAQQEVDEFLFLDVAAKQTIIHV
jgi:hypothetical protein